MLEVYMSLSTSHTHLLIYTLTLCTYIYIGKVNPNSDSSFFLLMKLDLFSGLTFVFLILHLTRYINLLPTSSLRLGTLSPTHAEHRNNVNYVHWTDCSFLNMEALRPEIHDDIFPSGFHCDDLKLLRNPCAEKWNLEGCENCEK